MKRAKKNKLIDIDAKHDLEKKAGPVLICLADVEPSAVSWLWQGRIPAGRITLLVGRPGEGKSFFTTDLAAHVTTGRSFPDGSACPKGSVVMISAEDDPADTIRPRLDAHGADTNYVHLLSAVRREDRGGTYDRMISLADVEDIEVTLVRHPDCKLLVIDPIGSFLGGNTDAHRDNAVRAILAPISKLAEKYGVAVVLVAHRRKSTGTNADEMTLGSVAFTGIARSVLHLTRDSKNKDRRLLVAGKNNLSQEIAGLAFSIKGDPARIEWEADPVLMSADDALAAENQSREHKSGPEAVAINEALQWLSSRLALGPRLMKELLDEWVSGEGGSERTLKRAKKSLGVIADRNEVPGPWWWRLPDKDTEQAKEIERGPLGILAEISMDLPRYDTENPKVAKLNSLGIAGTDRVQVTI